MNQLSDHKSKEEQVAKKIELKRKDYLEWLEDQKDWIEAEIIMYEDDPAHPLDDIEIMDLELQTILDIIEIVKKYEGK